MTNKKCLVFETLGKVSDLEMIKESQDGLMRLHGVFGVCGVKNNNNRIYNKHNYGMMVETLQKEITTGSVLGELEHPNTMNITLENVSHKIESIEMNEDGTITGTIVLLNTPKGKIAQAIAEASGSLYISSRGAGSIDESGNVTLSTIKTYDLVGTPGFSQAKLNLQKGQKFESLCESLEDGTTPMCAIISEGDDLLDDDDKKDKSDDSSKEEPKKEDDKKSDDGEEKKDEPKKEEDNKNSDSNTTMNELKEAIDALTEKVTSLEAELHVAQEALSDKDDQIANLTETVNSIKPVNYDAIETWVLEEFAPEFKDEVNEENQSWITEEFAPLVQNWVCEEFAPEVQNWVCEEFGSTLEGWINEEFAPEQAANIENKVNENVSAFMESQKADKLSDIDAMLEAIDQNKTENPLKVITESVNKENKFKGVYVVENMPAQYQPAWNMLSETKQQEIIRSSRAYDFTKEGVLESFWSNADLTEQKVMTESHVDVNPIAAKQNAVFAQMMRLRQTC